MNGRVSSGNPNVRRPLQFDMFLTEHCDRMALRRNYREMRAAGICSYQARSIIFTTLIAGHYSSESR